MADISGLRSSVSGGAGRSSVTAGRSGAVGRTGSGNGGTATVRGAADSGGSPSRSPSRQPEERQFILVDGRELDRFAPRGTYVDLLV